MKLVIEGVGKLYNGKAWGYATLAWNSAQACWDCWGRTARAPAATLSGWQTRAAGAATPPMTGRMLFHALYRH